MQLPSWEARYFAVVPGKLSASEAKIIFELIEEDALRFVQALDEFAALSEDLCS